MKLKVEPMTTVSKMLIFTWTKILEPGGKILLIVDIAGWFLG